MGITRKKIGAMIAPPPFWTNPEQMIDCRKTKPSGPGSPHTSLDGFYNFLSITRHASANSLAASYSSQQPAL
jgi:hypothetical protein